MLQPLPASHNPHAEVFHIVTLFDEPCFLKGKSSIKIDKKSFPQSNPEWKALEKPVIEGIAESKHRYILRLSGLTC